jgi:thymidylate synthase
MSNNEEEQYLNLIQKVIQNGNTENTRNGETISVFGEMMRFNLENNKIPILTTKKLAWKTCLKELLWFISGSTDNRKLIKQNVHIWDANASREFLDQNNLFNNKENDLGPIYSHQWRHFNAPYDNFDTDYTGQGIDQLQQIIDNLKNPDKRTSRRLIMTAWNPCQLNQMALPPCHILCQFNVHSGNKLSCALYQRSGDIGLGVPFNIASYSFLTHLLAKHCGLEAYEFVYFLGNAHIYKDHVSVLQEQVKLSSYEFPTINILNIYENINDYKIDDFGIDNYKHHPTLNMKFIA